MGHFKGRKGKSQITYVGNTVVSQKNLKYELLFETLIQFIVHDSTWMEPQALHEQILKITIWEILRKEVFSRPCPFIQILFWLYPDFIQILFRFYPHFLKTYFTHILFRFYSDFIWILSSYLKLTLFKFYPDFICIKSELSGDKIWIKGHRRASS